MSREAMKHTPGPWRLCFDGQIDGSDGRRICAFDWDSYGEFKDSNNASNARLIAAAPDMLDALQRAREVLLWNLGDDARIDAAFDAVTAAINKATYIKEQTA